MGTSVTLPLPYQILNGVSPVDAIPVMGDLNYIANQVNANAVANASLAANTGAGLVGTSSGITVQQTISNFEGIAGSSYIGYSRNSTLETVQQALDVLYYGIANVQSPQFTGGATIDNNVTDAYPAISAALASGAKIVFLPPPTTAYYLSAGITVPADVTLYGMGFAMDSTIASPKGTTLIFNLTVANCITLVGSYASCKIQGFNILRQAGTPPALSNGIYNLNTYGAKIQEVFALSHAIGLTNKGGTTVGIAMFADTFCTGAIYDSHIVIDSWPEQRFINCRFGSNGTADQNCNSFIRVQGGNASNASGGPNTLVMTSCQFNQGNGTAVTNWLAFQNKLGGSISDTTDWQFSNCYVETCSNGIYVDSSWSSVARLYIDNMNFNSVSPFINPATTSWDVNNWQISNSKMAGGFAYTSTTNHLNGLIIDNIEIGGAVSLNGAGSLISSIACTNVRCDAGLTLTGSFTTDSKFGGNLNGGSLTFTATGLNLDVSPYNSGEIQWTPTLTIGGSSTGVTGSFSGEYSVTGRVCSGNYRILLSSIGGLTGALNITGFPYAASGVTPFDASGGYVTYAQNFVGLTGQLTGRMNSTTTMLINQSGATGTSGVTNASMVNNTVIYGTFSFPI